VYHFLSRGCFQAGLTFYRNFTLLLLFFFTYTAILCHQQLQNREIARPDESRRRRLALEALRRFFSSFAPIYRSQFHGIDISPGQIRAPSLLSLSPARSLRCTRAFTYPLDLPFSSLRSPRTPPLRHEPRREKRVITARWIQMVPRQQGYNPCVTLNSLYWISRNSHSASRYPSSFSGDMRVACARYPSSLVFIK